MKKILLLTFLMIFNFFNTYSQSGENCNEAIEITAGSYTVDGINGDEFELNCTEYDASNGELLWFSYTPDQDYLVTVTTDLIENDGLDTRFHVYSGNCEDLQCVSGDDDSGDGYLSYASFFGYSGITYFIAWDDRWGDENFEFYLEESDPPPPPPFDFNQININSFGLERGLVDMNGDGLDDLVSIQSSNINLFIQSEQVGFEAINIATEQAACSPSWSMAAGDFDRNAMATIPMIVTKRDVKFVPFSNLKYDIDVKLLNQDNEFYKFF